MTRDLFLAGRRVVIGRNIAAGFRKFPPDAPNTHTQCLLPMFDCHAHLTDPSLITGLDGMLAEAEAVGVTGIVSVSETLEDAVQVLYISQPNERSPFPSTLLLLLLFSH